MHFTVEPTEVGNKGNSVSMNLGDNTTNASSEETSSSEGRSPVGCLSETHNSSIMAEKKVVSARMCQVQRAVYQCLCNGGKPFPLVEAECHLKL